MRNETLTKVSTFMDFNPYSRDMTDKEFLVNFIIKSCPLVCVSCAKSIHEEIVREWIQDNDLDEVMRAKRHLARNQPLLYGTRDHKLLEKKLEAQRKTKEVLNYAR